MINMAERGWCDVDLTPLDEDDLPETIRELSDVAASWRNIGTQLGIRHNRLEAIHGDKPLDCLRQMLATWLQKNYNVERFGEPTWVKLVEVVSHSAGGGNPSLAMKIAKKHKATQSSPDVPGVSEVDSAPLDLGDDFFDVQSELVPVAANWKSIGIALHLKPDVWENVDTQYSSNPRACLTLIVKEWLKRNYNVKRFGEPTWQRLVEAVGHPAGGGNMEVARRIAMKHMVERISTFRSQQIELKKTLQQPVQELQEEVQQERNEKIIQLEPQLQVVKDSDQRLKGKVELLKQNCEEMQGELTSVRTTLSTTDDTQESLIKKLQVKEDERAALTERLQTKENERAVLTEKLERNEDEKAALEGVVKERDERITLLEHQLQVVKDSEQQLKEKVDRERAQNRELTAAKSDSEGQFAVLQQQIKEQQDELRAMSWELHDLRQQLRIREGQVEDLEQLASSRNEDVEYLKEELQQAMQELGEQRALVLSLQITLKEREVVFEKVQQDLCTAQENIVELAGARSEQQHLGTPVSVVDQSVHEALQLAYENMEKYYLRVNSQYQSAQETIHVLEARNAKMVAHVEKARQEFEAKASECVELQRRLKQGGGGDADEHHIMLEKVQQDLCVAQNNVVKLVTGAHEQQQQLSTAWKAKEENRVCPICGTQFPAHISHQVFEDHTKQHFQD